MLMLSRKAKCKYILEIFVLINVLCTLYTKSDQYEKEDGLLYIVMWSGSSYVPFNLWQLQQKAFTTMNCEFQNCYIVDDIDFFGDVTKYDAILFNAIDLKFYTELPMVRSDNQIYIFVSTESSTNYPVIEKFNYFFNYTWTYKMDSDIYYPYFVTRNKSGKVIAPNTDTKWIDIKDMKPTSEYILDKLHKKKIAAAWFVTNCNPKTRLNYLRSLRKGLQKYEHDVDVFGVCEANKYCAKNIDDDCFALVESDYYFYLSFENSNTKDYVTEKVMNALDYYAVPVVMGGADYSKFMPDGIYLNANKLTAEEMAEKMVEAIRNKKHYYEYFKWHEHYSYYTVYESADTDPLCTLCAFLNEASEKNQRRVYARFTDWWNNAKDINVMRDIIVYYNQTNSKTVYKSFLNDAWHEISPSEPVIEDEPTIVNTIANIAGEIFKYYFF